MTTETPTPRDSRWPHRFAVLLVCATFPLIWVGGLVTTTESGMAVPDYPSTFGHNMFLYPLSTWLGGSWQVFIEHGHRLLGALSGLLSIALCIALWRCDERRWLRWLGVVVLAVVVFQGLLGGFRVIENERLLAMVHGCVGPAFFGLTVALAVFTSRYWRREEREESHSSRTPLVGRLALVVAGLAFMQILLGAQVRHVPVTASAAWFQTAIVFHVVIALALTAHVLWLGARTLRRGNRRKELVRPAAWLMGLMLVQLALGGGAWVLNYGWPEWFQDYAFAQTHLNVARGSGQNLVTTAHVAVGSLIFAFAVMLGLRAGRREALSDKPRMTRMYADNTEDKTGDATDRTTSVVKKSVAAGRLSKRLLAEVRG